MLRLLCAVLVLAGCRPNPLDWEIRIEPPELRDRVVRLDARIASGACPGSDVAWDETVHPRGSPADLPELDEGTWCFTARAGDAACHWIGEGSTTAELPSEGPIVITVTETAPASNCRSTCDEGICEGGGSDLCEGAETCSRTCAGHCAYTCEDAATCTFDCRGQSCDVVCDGSSLCDVDCSGGACSLTCTDSADCDFRCDRGACTFACEDASNCDTSCVDGVCDGP